MYVGMMILLQIRGRRRRLVAAYRLYTDKDRPTEIVHEIKIVGLHESYYFFFSTTLINDLFLQRNTHLLLHLLSNNCLPSWSVAESIHVTLHVHTGHP